MIPRKCFRLAAAGLGLAFSLASAQAEDWSRFRGPNGSGVVEDGAYPAEFGPDKNVVWKAAVRLGKSSPVLTERHVFLTAFDEGKFFTQCFNRQTGELLWERSEERTRESQMNRLNEPAASSPVTDGENVYVLFADAGMVSYDAAGQQRWKTPLDPFATLMGHGASLILAGGSIVLEADQSHDSYIAAFNPADGETRWKISRQEGDGWATPALLTAPNGSSQIVTSSRGWLAAHRPSDGKRLWESNSVPPAIVASPAVAGDTVYVFGYGNAPTIEGRFDSSDKNGDGRLTPDEHREGAFLGGLARLRGNRDGVLTKEEWLEAARATVAPSSLTAFRFDSGDEPPRELWRHERNFSHVVPSALVYRGVLYLVKNGGILETLDAETGEVLKRGRLREAVEGYSASPVAADGKVFFTGEGGKISVVQAGGEWETIAVNDLGDEAFATPALSGGRIFVRTNGTLYCFGEGD